MAINSMGEHYLLLDVVIMIILPAVNMSQACGGRVRALSSDCARVMGLAAFMAGFRLASTGFPSTA